MAQVLERQASEGRHPTGWKANITVADGETKYIYLPKVWHSGSCSVRAVPGAGATADVYDGNPTPGSEGTYTGWNEWTPGGVTAVASDTLVGVVDALKLTSSGGASVFEVRA